MIIIAAIKNNTPNTKPITQPLAPFLPDLPNILTVSDALSVSIDSFIIFLGARLGLCL
jgi:hypothetical protein